MVKALGELGDKPFFHVNSDTIWIDGVRPNLGRLADAFDPDKWTRCCCSPPPTSIGYTGRGDFAMASDGRLIWRGERDVVPFVFAGAAILAPALFRAPPGAFPLTTRFIAPPRPSALRAAARRRVDACGLGGSHRRRGRDPGEHGVAATLPQSVCRIHAMPAKPNVFTIPASAPFLPALIDALIVKEVPGFPFLPDPLLLAGATLYLPTLCAPAARCARSFLPASRPAPPSTRLSSPEVGRIDPSGSDRQASI